MNIKTTFQSITLCDPHRGFFLTALNGRRSLGTPIQQAVYILQNAA